MPNPSNILIVDDNEKNRNILHDWIITLEHKPTLAENGLSALTQMEKHPPDLILLDILMPEMDGYEVLSRMKKDPKLRRIPVIVISAVEETDSVVRCIEMGAQDYLVKPFNPTLLKARISNSLKWKRLHDQEIEYQRWIEGHNLQLEEQVRLKTRELSDANERLKILDKAKTDFLNLIAHELRTPLVGILGVGQMLMDPKADEKAREKLKGIFQRSSKRLLSILDDSLLFAQIHVSDGAFPLKSIPLKETLQSAIKTANEFAESKQISIVPVPDFDWEVMSEERLLTRALTSLLETAIKFSTEGNEVRLSCDVLDNDVTISIESKGRGIPLEAVPKFFEVFSIVDPITPGGDLGLGPPVAERIIKLLNGSVEVENREPPGVLFTIKLMKTTKKRG